MKRIFVVFLMIMMFATTVIPHQAYARQIYYTPDELGLSYDGLDYVSMKILKVTSKYVVYQKVKNYTDSNGDMWLLPMNNKKYKLKYNKNIDMYTLKNIGTAYQWKKACHGFTRKKLLTKCSTSGKKFKDTYWTLGPQKGKVKRLMELYLP